MSPLRLRMLEHMRLRHYSPRTIKSYLAQVAAFARHLGRSPDTATLEEVSAYLLCLEERGMSQSLLSNAYSGIKVLFVAVLDKAWDARILPRSRRERRLPAVLSAQEELSASMLESLCAYYRSIRPTVYLFESAQTADICPNERYRRCSSAPRRGRACPARPACHRTKKYSLLPSILPQSHDRKILFRHGFFLPKAHSTTLQHCP